jgi:hypothetical protein
LPNEFNAKTPGCKAAKRLWEFPNGEHATIMEPPEKFWKEAVEFWQTKRPPKMQESRSRDSNKNLPENNKWSM